MAHRTPDTTYREKTMENLNRSKASENRKNERENSIDDMMASGGEMFYFTSACRDKLNKL